MHNIIQGQPQLHSTPPLTNYWKIAKGMIELVVKFPIILMMQDLIVIGAKKDFINNKSLQVDSLKGHEYQN